MVRSSNFQKRTILFSLLELLKCCCVIFIYICIFPEFLIVCRKQWKDNTPPSGARKSTSGGLAIGISACEDHQLAADTSVRDRYISLTYIHIYIFIYIFKRVNHAFLTYHVTVTSSLYNSYIITMWIFSCCFLSFLHMYMHYKNIFYVH